MGVAISIASQIGEKQRSPGTRRRVRGRRATMSKREKRKDEEINNQIKV